MIACAVSLIPSSTPWLRTTHSMALSIRSRSVQKKTERTCIQLRTQAHLVRWSTPIPTHIPVDVLRTDTMASPCTRTQRLNRPLRLYLIPHIRFQLQGKPCHRLVEYRLSPIPTHINLRPHRVRRSPDVLRIDSMQTRYTKTHLLNRPLRLCLMSRFRSRKARHRLVEYRPRFHSHLQG